MWTKLGSFAKDIWAVIAKNVIDSSTSKSVNKTDILKVLRNALFVGSSASLIFVIESLAENFLSSIAQGVAIAGLNCVIELLFKFIKSNEEKIDEL